MQADPNATGLVLIQWPLRHGQAIVPEIDQFNLEGVFRDGTNRYQYLAGNALQVADPLGLYIPLDVVDTVESGLRLGAIAFQLFDEYAANQRADAIWAEDWTQGDDWYSQSGQYDYYSHIQEAIDNELEGIGLASGAFTDGSMARRGVSPIRGLLRATRIGYQHIRKQGAEVVRVGQRLSSGRLRFWDGIKHSNGAIKLAIEVKSTRTGYIKASARIKQQIKDDAELINQGATPRVQWQFIPRAKSVTSIKASPQVMRWLQDAAKATNGKFSWTGLAP
nr:MAG: hypothetical protein DIU57_20195 [Pseudomonadota bacterium]